MTDFANFRSSFFIPCGREIITCVTFAIGLFSGCFAAYYFEPYTVSLMRSALLQPVSIVGLLANTFLPLLFTYLSFLFSKPIIIWVVCFLKAAAFGFSGAMIAQLFDSAYWLIQFLFLFSDCLFLTVLFLLWLTPANRERNAVSFDFVLCTIVSVLIAAADYFVISPFLLGLL